MEVLLREKGIQYETERHILVKFRGHVVGQLRADIIIDNTIILELKAIKTLTDGMEHQAQKYLDLTGLRLAYLVNFPLQTGREVEIREIALGPSEGELVKAFDKIRDHHRVVSADLTQLLPGVPVPSSDEILPVPCSAVPLGRLD
jgi:GxxExxY protein|tara:strand:- start:121 stop:555 length:435 start_codon:yes stop_codon:yes gene_type:complete